MKLRLLLVCLLYSGSLWAQDETAAAGPALLSVDRKYAPAAQVGLYLRQEGVLRRLWQGEPYDAHAAPDRSTLVVERWEGRVFRLDPSGKVTFEKRGLDHPVDVELASDGTIVVVLNELGQVIGLDPESGAVCWRRSGFSKPFDVALTSEGGLVLADSGAGRVVALDAQGRQLWSREGLGFPNTVEVLEDGHVLVTTWSGGEVIELDEGGRQVWRVKISGTVYRAQRRRDGTTLIVDGAAGRIVVVNSAGRELRRESFTPGCVDYEPLPQG